MISSKFPRYTDFDPLVPVWCVTPKEGRCIHRFFDTSPFSPSGRYMALLRMPQEERLPLPGEKAEIVLVDLYTAEERVIAETRGWEPQMGANINWGTDDNSLYFNDVDISKWETIFVQLNLHTSERRIFEGSIYRISPDGKHVISACTKRMRRTQYGYGVVVPDNHVPRNLGFSDNDGLYITNIETGDRRLLTSIKDIFEQATPTIDKQQYENGECYGFHCKFNPQGDRILFTMRHFKTVEAEPWNMIKKDLDYFVITMKLDGSDMYVAVGPEQWKKGGHHINWFPDGKRLSMNLCIDDDHKLYLVQVDYDGTNMKKITPNILGSGHPTVHPNGKYTLTDAYEYENLSSGDGTVPIRLINLEEEIEQTIVEINVSNPGAKITTTLRVDPHPAWDNDHRFIAFNGFVDGSRRVFIADLSEIIK